MTDPVNIDLPELTSDQLLVLRELARKATLEHDWKVSSHAHPEPGCRCLSCYQDTSTFGLNIMVFCDEQKTGDSDCENQGFTYEDAVFVEAANPKTVLALLDRLAAVEAELAHSREALKEATRP